MSDLDKSLTHPKWINFSKASYLCVVWFLVYIPQNVNQNTMTSLLSAHFKSLGFSLQGIFYLFQLVGAFLGPSVIKKWGLRKTFSFGGAIYSLMLIAQILPSWYD